MSQSELRALKERIGATRDLDEALLHDAVTVLKGVFPKTPAHPEALSEPTEAVLHLIDRCLPGWTIVLNGQATEPDGHWKCVVRESTSTEDDLMVGAGRAPTVALAILDALVGVGIAKAEN